MNRSEAWVRIVAACSDHLSSAQAADYADNVLRRFDTRFRGSAREDSDAVAPSEPTSAEEFVTNALLGYVRDPADSNYQRGFLAAMIQVAEEMIIDDQAPMLADLKRQLRGEHEEDETQDRIMQILDNYVATPPYTNRQRGYLACALDLADMTHREQSYLYDLCRQPTEPATTPERVASDLVAGRVTMQQLIEGYIESIS